MLTTLAVLFGMSLIGAQTWITLSGAGVRPLASSRLHSKAEADARTWLCTEREKNRPNDDQSATVALANRWSLRRCELRK